MNWTLSTWNRNRWPNFAYGELACSHCGANEMNAAFMDQLQSMRVELDEGIVINSGYRCSMHEIEAAKPQPGSHARGKAADLKIYSPAYAHRLLGILFGRYSGVGISLVPGKPAFVHVDSIEPGEGHWTRPNVWSYS